MKFKITKHKFIENNKYDGLPEVLILRWDYKGHDLFGNVPWTQRDWIQTLQTKINECANWLYTHIQDIDVIDINTITTSMTGWMLFEEMPMFQYNLTTFGENWSGILGNRYVVSVDREINDDCIYVGTELQPQLCKIIIDNLGI